MYSSPHHLLKSPFAHYAPDTQHFSSTHLIEKPYVVYTTCTKIFVHPFISIEQWYQFFLWDVSWKLQVRNIFSSMWEIYPCMVDIWGFLFINHSKLTCHQGRLLMYMVVKVMVGGRIMVGCSLMSSWNIVQVGRLLTCCLIDFRLFRFFISSSLMI